jgi:hypothetical protein
MTDSILDGTKKVLNVDSSYTAFDEQIILFINGVFSTLNQLGVGPEAGFMISDKNAVWSDFLGGDPRLSHIKNYMYLRVRMLFDPPTLGYVIDAMKEQIKELEWRINVQREHVAWIDPDPDLDTTVLDGGAP